MKTWINQLFILCVLSLTLFSCEKDEDRLILKPGTSPALSASASSMELTADKAEQDAVVISWTAADYGYNAAVKYTLQFIKEGGDFKDARNVEVEAGALKKTYTVSQLNNLAVQLGLVPNNEGTLQFRVKSEVLATIDATYSNVVSLKVTPYLDIIEYVSLWVPGSHQGWNPGTAPKVSSVKDNGQYEGYINFPDAKTNFKFTLAPNWDNDFGGTNTKDKDGKDKNEGKLAPKASDLTVNGSGYYLVKANTNELTWSATRTTWGVIGSATANGWDSDQDLTYDATEQVWKATLTLIGNSEIKFRANDDWEINFGDDNADGSLEYGAANIKIKDAGNYAVILDLRIPGNYTYSVTKL